MIRQPVVAGKFYSDSSSILKDEIKAFITPNSKKQNAIGIVSPHAGYIYSGSVAGAVFSGINIPDTVIIIGPNHTGYGKSISIISSGSWQMPNGKVAINSELSELIKVNLAINSDDELGHMNEHSVEVQIPFIQFTKEQFDIVPLTMMFMELEECRKIGIAISAAIRKFGKPVLIIASSDMTHYEPREIAGKKDGLAIQKILDLDPDGLYETVKKNMVSMCGVIPVTIMLVASIELGAYTSELIKYSDSGEVSGDIDNVVGYAGFTVK